MTQVTTAPFTVRIQSLVDPYAAYADGEVNRIYDGSLASRGTATNPAPAIMAYSGCVIDAPRGRLVFFGGGHADYNGNEVYQLNIASYSPTFERDYLPTGYQPIDAALALANADNYNKPGWFISPAQPISRHTYNGQVFVPGYGMYSAGSSTYSGTDYNGVNLWWVYPNDPCTMSLYNTTNQTWTFKSSHLLTTSVPRPEILVYSASRNKVYTTAKKTLTSAYRPDLFSTSVVPPNLSLYTGVPRVWEFDPTNDTWTAFADNFPDNIENQYQVAYDSQYDRLVVVGYLAGGVRKVYVYPLTTKLWSVVSITGGEPSAAPSDGLRESDALVYSTYTNRALFVQASTRSVWALSINSSGTSGTWAQVGSSGVFAGMAQAFGTCWDSQRNVMFVAFKNNLTQSVDVYAMRA